MSNPNHIPLILVGNKEELKVKQFDLVVYLSEEKENLGSDLEERINLNLICPSPFPSDKIVEIYTEVLLSLAKLVKVRTSKEEILIASKNGINRGSAIAIALRAILYKDTDLAVATQVAQRPQCLPNLFISQIADTVFDLDGKLYRSVSNYLATGLAISSTGESFSYDPDGDGDPDPLEI